MAAPGHSRRLILLLLLLATMVPQLVTPKTIRECLGPNAAILHCEDGQAILVDHAVLGVSEGTTSPSTICPKTSNECHTFTPKIADLCNRKKTCSLAYPGDTVINLFHGCGLTNYIDVSYSCIQTSTAISICGWSGETGAGTSYIVSNNYPFAIPPQPHRCQCTIQKPPDSTALQTGVALILIDAFFTGSSCQQKLYVEYPEHSTQSNTVCSSSQRVTRRTLFSRPSIQSGEIIIVTFDKVIHIGDGGTFVIEVQVTGIVAIKCTALSPTSPSTSQTTTTGTRSSTGRPFPTSTSKTATVIPLVNHSTVAHSHSTTDELSTSLHQHASTLTWDPPTTQQTVGLGAGLGVGLAVAMGAGVIFIVMYRRRLKGLTTQETNRTRAESQFALRATEIPLAPTPATPGQHANPEDNTTASSGHYEPLHGVTTPTPATYENVQASNYESLDVPRDEADGAGLPVATYEVVHPTTQPTEANYVNY